MGFDLLLLLVHYASSIDWIALFSFPDAARICRGEDVFLSSLGMTRVAFFLRGYGRTWLICLVVLSGCC